MRIYFFLASIFFTFTLFISSARIALGDETGAALAIPSSPPIESGLINTGSAKVSGTGDGDLSSGQGISAYKEGVEFESNRYEVHPNSIWLQDAAIGAYAAETNRGAGNSLSSSFVTTPGANVRLKVEQNITTGMSNDRPHSCALYLGGGFDGNLEGSLKSAPNDIAMGALFTSAGLACSGPGQGLLLVGPILRASIGTSNLGNTGALSGGGRVVAINHNNSYIKLDVTGTLLGQENGGDEVGAALEVGLRRNNVNVGVSMNYSQISNRTIANSEVVNGSVLGSNVEALGMQLVAGVAWQ